MTYIKVAPYDGCRGCVGVRMSEGKMFAGNNCSLLFDEDHCYEVNVLADDNEEHQRHIWIEDTEAARVKYMAERLTN